MHRRVDLETTTTTTRTMTTDIQTDYFTPAVHAHGIMYIHTVVELQSSEITITPALYCYYKILKLRYRDGNKAWKKEIQ